MESISTNIIIAGVGGQGSILAARIIADAALSENHQCQTDGTSNPGVRVGETFGAAMRGGAVSSHIRIGDVVSPLVPEQQCDLIIGLEPLEALRLAVDYLAPGGWVVMNTDKNIPTDVKTGMTTYPEIDQIVNAIESLGGKVLVVDATELSKQAGTIKTMNVVMLGVAFSTGILPLTKESLVDAISARVPSKTLKTNLKAFELGLEARAGCQKS
jgi:indolepyruvate ferredoxin oxidoreductase beta subunit